MAERAAQESISGATYRFVSIYALAWAGGVVAYTPLLTVLLPQQIVQLAGRTAGVTWLAWMSLAGALAASLGGVVFGWLSDITHNRRGWMIAGLVTSCFLLLLIGQLESFAGLILGIITWQLSLNMLLGPLSALAADVIPDHAKGLVGGLQAFAPGLAALVGTLVTQPGLNLVVPRLSLVAIIIVLCVAPLLVMPLPAASRPMGTIPATPRRLGRVGRMWIARLCVQVAEATLFAYMFFWLSGLDPHIQAHEIARLFSMVLLFAAPLALAIGRWSDRHDRPIAPLRASALMSALGLFLMALSPDGLRAMMAYGLFGLASSVFLALHSAQTLRILPRADRRGRDLGIFNLANTVPSLVMPWLAMAFVPTRGFAFLFFMLAGLALLAAFLLARGSITSQD